MTLLTDFLILITGLVWIPIVPLRIALHAGIHLWRRSRQRSYWLFFVYWGVMDLVVFLSRDLLFSWRFETPSWGLPVGFILLILSLFVHIWTIRSLGLPTFFTLPEMSPEKMPAPLIAVGPYRFVRHPFYIAEWFLLLALAFLTSSWTIAALFILSLLSSPLVTRLEEKELVGRFGATYRDYQKRVPRLIPLWKRT